MKLKHQIFIDRYIGSPIAYGMNFIIRIIGKVLNLDHSLNKSFNTIAVAKYKGLGSIVQATPLLQTLRKNYPNAKIIFVTTEGNKLLLEKMNGIDEVLVVRDQNLIGTMVSIISLITTLWRRKVGVFLDLEIYSNTSSLITSFSLARNRMGYYLRSSHYRLGMYTHMMYYNIKAPVSEAYLQFARLLGCKQIVSNLYPLKQHFNVPNSRVKPYIIVNTNASDLRIERRWEQTGFVAIIDWLQEKFPQYQQILIGAAAEKIYVDQIFDQVKQNGKVENWAGRTSLDELISLISNAELMITNDTGPMHLGFALETNIVALFGPCSPHQYGHHQNVSIIYRNVYCSPCVHEFAMPPCHGDNQCMKQITVEQVKQEIEKGLTKKIEGKKNDKDIIYTTEEHVAGEGTLGIVGR